MAIFLGLMQAREVFPHMLDNVVELGEAFGLLSGFFSFRQRRRLLDRFDYMLTGRESLHPLGCMPPIPINCP